MLAQVKIYAHRIASDLGRAFPNIETLILTNNHLGTLRDLETLAGMPTLTILSLVDNTVTKQHNYRAFVISRLPNLRVLDFKKIKPNERAAAEAMFGAAKRKPVTTIAASETGAVSTAPAPAPVQPKMGPTPEQIAQIKEAIAGASSLEEVAKLEKALKAGNYDYISQHIAEQKRAAALASTPAPAAAQPPPPAEAPADSALAEAPAEAPADSAPAEPMETEASPAAAAPAPADESAADAMDADAPDAG